MSASSHLRLIRVDDENGTVETVESRELEAMEAELQKLRIDLRMAKRDVVAKNRRIADLERDKILERLHHPDRAQIERIAGFWHKLCRGGDKRVTPLSPVRFDAVAGLVEMEVIVKDANGKRAGHRRRYKPVDFEIAIRGARFDHYIKVRKNGTEQHFDDLEFICRDPKNFEECMARCPLEVVGLARAREEAHTGGREFHTSASPGATSHGGSHGQRAVGCQCHRLPDHGQTERPVVRLGVAGRVGALPASVV